MLATKPTHPTPAAPGGAELAELLAAHYAMRPTVDALVRALAPRTGAAVLAELAGIAEGRIAPADASPALRWVLPDVRRALAPLFRAASA